MPRYTAIEAARIIEQLQDEDSDIDDIDDQYEEEQVAESDSTAQSEEEEEADDDELEFNPNENLIPYVSREGTHWHQHPLRNNAVRRPDRNIIRHQAGATNFILQRSNDIVDVFIELFSRQNLEEIVNFTNAEAASKGIDDFGLDDIELRAFVGLNFARGVTKGRNEPLCSFWSESTGRPLFRDTMSRNRYQLILRFLRFDSRNDRRQRRALDPFCLIRNVWDRVIASSARAYRPRDSITVDEQLLPCKSRCKFIQYMPQKPGKFGIKFWLACCSSSYYVLQGHPYVGRDPDRGPEIGLGEHTVLKLTETLEQGVNVTTDNYFTSQSLALKLIDQNNTLIGTVRSNRREIPQEMHQFCRTAELHSSYFLYSEKSTLVAYKAKRNKSVIVLSSMHENGRVMDEEKRKPEIIHAYNESKFGVDKADEMLRAYSTKAGSRRWPIAVFGNILDICGLNAYIICKSTHLWRSTRRDFLLELSKKLCHQLQERKRLQRPVALVRHPDAADNDELPRRTTCKRCHRNKTKVSCAVCRTFCCGTCSYQVCNTCM